MADRLQQERLTLASITTAGAATYTVDQIVGGLIERDPVGSDRTDVTPTATQLCALLKQEGDTLLCYLINTADAAEAITISGGTGVTISNAGQTIAQNESALLLFRRTGTSTVTCYLVGS